MNSELTPKQERIFQFIQSYVEENHVPPSLREIGKHFELSVGTVQDQLEAIRRKGFLNKEGAQARGLRLSWAMGQIPILGRVHAGPLHAALEDVEGHVAAGSHISPRHHFALRVRGDSMIGAGILEGDTVIVRAQETAEDGDVVVGRVEDETTVKYFRKRGGRPVLEPANPRYPAIADVPFDIVGVVVEVRRHYKRS
jgi:repressor LexA